MPTLAKEVNWLVGSGYAQSLELFSHAPKTTPFHGNQPAFLGSSSSRQQLFERRQAVGFLEGFVPANAVDARETHRYAGFVAGGTVHAVEGDFEDDGGVTSGIGSAA